MATLKNTTINDTGFLRLPEGTTAQRPASSAGQVRLNSDNGKIEKYNADLAAWVGTADAGVVATGGDSVYDVDVEGTTYRVHAFTSTGNSNFTVTSSGEVEYLIVAGGGGGSGNFYDDGSGGGAGGLITGTTAVTPQTYTITVGAGGGINGSGNNNSAFGLTALGGGRGAGHRGRGVDGGSGGGGGGYYGENQTRDYGGGTGLQPGSASGGFGNDGGGVPISAQPTSSTYPFSGGGGGAGSPGFKPEVSGGGTSGIGGAGLAANISGILTFYAGGGGGVRSKPGGIGGGAAASYGRGGTAALPATPNTGGGGGGGRFYSGETGIPSAGGSGIVIIRYPLRQENPVTAPGKIIDTGLKFDLDFAHPNVYQGSGSVIRDSRLNGITATPNSVTFVDPRTHRSAFQFDSSNSTGEIVFSRDEFIFGTGDFSIEIWANPTTIESLDTLYELGDYRDGILFRPDNATVQLYMGYNQVQNSRVYNHTRVIGRWDHYMLTRESGVVRLYINGVKIESDYANNTNLTLGLNSTCKIGSSTHTGGQRWNGYISYFRIYNRSLSAQESAQNYNATRWRFGV